MNKSLVISEVFGPTFQGEGRSSGRICHFVRLSMCNLACSWCDTPYTWDWKRYSPSKEQTKISPAELIKQVPDSGLLVITGGEPLIQRIALAEFIDILPGEVFVEIETNGTLPPLNLVRREGVSYNVSPKLNNSKNTRNTIVRESIESFVEIGSDFKFVVCSSADINEVSKIVLDYSISEDKVWIMPEGEDPDDNLKVASDLAELVLENGWNLSLRMQNMLWPNQRGR